MLGTLHQDPAAPLSLALLSHAASPDSPTGAERSMAQLAAGLHERGHRVAVVVPGPWCLAHPLREKGVEVVRIGCRACWLTYHDALPFPVALVKWLRFAVPDPGGYRILRWLARWGADAVHVNCLPHVRGARWAAGRTLGLPLVWHLREILPAGARRRWFARRLRRSATRIVAVSEAVAGWVREEGLDGRLQVVHNGVVIPAGPRDRDAARDALGLPREGFLIGMFGQLLPHKGGPQFIAAARAALDRHPGLRFVLAGPGPASHLRALRAAIGPATGRIHLLPPQPTAENLLAAFDAACLPTLTPDPFPRSVLEAMASSLPVVAFRGGGVDEMVREGETGLLVDSGDVKGLSAAFSRLGDDPATGETMGRAGRLRAEREFSLDRHLDRMERLFVDLAGRA
jgi:glycosyltransferase involved in cell wall biosynthesis